MSSQIDRLHQLVISSDLLAPSDLYPVAFSWKSTINYSSSAKLLVYTHSFLNADACSSLIGAPVCLTTLSATRIPTYRTGIIQAINYQHSDGALHFYGLSIVSPDWLLTQNICTRSFVNRSTFDIVTSVLANYDFEWQWSEILLASESLQRPLALRTQSDVSDWDFVTGLLADIGISMLWVAKESIEDIGSLVLISNFDDLEIPSLNYNYSQNSVQSGQDTVDELQPTVMQRGTRTVTVRADGLSADTIYEGTADNESPLAIDSTAVLLASPSRVTSDADAIRLAKQWVAANNSHRGHYQATGSLRGMNVGANVYINNIPNIQSIETHCLSLQMIGVEPDSDSISYQHHTMIKDWLQRLTKDTQYGSMSIPAYAYEIARSTGIWVSAELLDSNIPYCPYPSILSFASHTYSGPTQARTGNANTSTTPSYASTVTDDTLQQTITTPVWAGLSAQSDDSTPPLRSLQLSSGTTHGWQFAPRDGQPVLLTYWYGDIDSPVISRSLYDGIGMGDTDINDITAGSSELAHRYNIKGGSSPRWHGSGLGHSQINDDDNHSGWISGIAQYGLVNSSEISLLFDDTPNKVGLKWSANIGTHADAMSATITDKATFAPSQHVIELGILRHRFSNHQSTNSGQGFRVATDNSLQITGNKGVLLSTFGIRHTQLEHESAWVNDAGQRQLKIGAELGETLEEAKQAHLQSTEALSRAVQSVDAFKTTAQVIDETLNTEVLGAPDVMLVSKDSILASASNTLWTAKTIVRQSGGTQSDVVAGNYKLTADMIESLSGVGGQAALSGLHISANTKPVAIQAQGGELQLHSQQGMTIGSESGQVNVSSPKRIKLQTSSGASITIDDSGIKLVCPGTIKIKAVKKSLVAGGRAKFKLPAMPKHHEEFFILKGSNGELIRNHRYIIELNNGVEFHGLTDAEGKTQTINTNGSKELTIHILDDYSDEYHQFSEDSYSE
ncbi:contractile injection system protein, VgrG/Pvc8 family [Psychrobacter cibarius]|nr:contractile injection system protein, VgrG/Pvc8 family [Psychrobacter cibarius]